MFDPFSILGAIGSLFGGASKSSQEAKVAQNNTALDQFKTELAGRIAGANQANTRATSIRTAPGARLGQSAQGNLVQNWKPVQTAWSGKAGDIPQVSGGYKDLTFDPVTKQIANNNQADALMRSEVGYGAQDVAPFLQQPNAPTMSSSSWVDSLLGLGGLGGGIAGLFAKKPGMTADPFSKG